MGAGKFINSPYIQHAPVRKESNYRRINSRELLITDFEVSTDDASRIDFPSNALFLLAREEMGRFQINLGGRMIKGGVVAGGERMAQPGD